MTFNGTPKLGPSDSLLCSRKPLAPGSAWLGRLVLPTVAKRLHYHLYDWPKDGKERVLNSWRRAVGSRGQSVSGQHSYLRLGDNPRCRLSAFPVITYWEQWELSKCVLGMVPGTEAKQ